MAHRRFDMETGDTIDTEDHSFRFHYQQSHKYSDWQERAGQDGFPRTEWCSDYGVVMYNDHLVAHCPGQACRQLRGSLILVAHSYKDQYLLSTNQLTSDPKFSPAIHFCNHLKSVAAVTGQTGGVLSHQMVFSGVLVECDTGAHIGRFSFKGNKKGRYVPTGFHQFSLSQDRTLLCAVLRYKPQRALLWSEGKYDILVYSRGKGGCQYEIVQKVGNVEHLHREGPISVLPPGYWNEKLLLINTQVQEAHQNQKTDYFITDIALESGNVRKALRYSDVPATQAMDWGNWIIQSAECNRTGSVLAICCEVTTNTRVHEYRMFVFNTSTLDLLNTIEFCSPVIISENISNLRMKGCYKNVSPRFSHCGSKLSVLHCSRPCSNTQDVLEGLRVIVYSLPSPKSLQDICQVTILRYVKNHNDLVKLPLPTKLLQKLHCF